MATQSGREAETAVYLGMPVRMDELDIENTEFYRLCGSKQQIHVQRCSSCNLLRVPPTTACPFCASPEATWVPVAGKGTLYSYGEVHHAIQPVFREFAPYLLLLVELDEQRDIPSEYDGLRLQANLVDAEGNLANQALVRQVGIGTRLKVVFVDLGDGLALPQWTIDEEATQPETPWRYAIE